MDRSVLLSLSLCSRQCVDLALLHSLSLRSKECVGLAHLYRLLHLDSNLIALTVLNTILMDPLLRVGVAPGMRY